MRTRHAHSWALAWVDGAWRDVDSTPPGWAEAEAFSASMWQPVKDLWAWGCIRSSNGATASDGAG